MVITKNPQIINDGEGVERREPSYIVDEVVNWYSHYEEQYGGSLKTKNRASTWPWHSTPRHTCTPMFMAALFSKDIEAI